MIPPTLPMELEMKRGMKSILAWFIELSLMNRCWLELSTTFTLVLFSPHLSHEIDFNHFYVLLISLAEYELASQKNKQNLKHFWEKPDNKNFYLQAPRQVALNCV